MDDPLYLQKKDQWILVSTVLTIDFINAICQSEYIAFAFESEPSNNLFFKFTNTSF